MFNLFKSKKLNTRLKRTTTVMYRHGDLLIQKINAMPPSAFPIPKQKTHNFPTGSTLAEGEISGHKHQLIGDGQVFVGMHYINRPRHPTTAFLTHSINDVKELYFKANSDLEIIHEEHKTLKIPQGVYKVTKERQFDPFKNKNKPVVD